MRWLPFLLINTITPLFKLIQTGGVKAVIYENLLLKHKLLIVSRSRQRAPALKPLDRLFQGWLTMLMNPGRIVKTAIIIKPATLLAFPFTPVSHPFVERLIGTIRREYLDQTFFWNSLDLERKLIHFKEYYNQYRVHSFLYGYAPSERCMETHRKMVNLDDYSWQTHCAGLFQTPIAV